MSLKGIIRSQDNQENKHKRLITITIQVKELDLKVQWPLVNNIIQ